jgi:hypothetical protein
MDYSLFCCGLKHSLPKKERVLPISALSTRALSTRSLPPRAVRLISEYSKPMTRPHWRKSLPIITTIRLYLTLSPPTSELQYIVLKNIKETEWYKMYYYIQHYGVKYFNENFYMYD